MLRWWQTRTQCCGHIVADTNVSLFARAGNICCGHKICVRDTKMFLISFRNILCPQQMFPGLRSIEAIMSNNVSATLCPRLPPPLCLVLKAGRVYCNRSDIFYYGDEACCRNKSAGNEIKKNLSHLLVYWGKMPFAVRLTSKFTVPLEVSLRPTVFIFRTIFQPWVSSFNIPAALRGLFTKYLRFCPLTTRKYGGTFNREGCFFSLFRWRVYRGIKWIEIPGLAVARKCFMKVNRMRILSNLETREKIATKTGLNCLQLSTCKQGNCVVKEIAFGSSLWFVRRIGVKEPTVKVNKQGGNIRYNFY